MSGLPANEPCRWCLPYLPNPLCAYCGGTGRVLPEYVEPCDSTPTPYPHQWYEQSRGDDGRFTAVCADCPSCTIVRPTGEPVSITGECANCMWPELTLYTTQRQDGLTNEGEHLGDGDWYAHEDDLVTCDDCGAMHRVVIPGCGVTLTMDWWED